MNYKWIIKLLQECNNDNGMDVMDLDWMMAERKAMSLG